MISYRQPFLPQVTALQILASIVTQIPSWGHQEQILSSHLMSFPSAAGIKVYIGVSILPPGYNPSLSRVFYIRKLKSEENRCYLGTRIVLK